MSPTSPDPRASLAAYGPSTSTQGFSPAEIARFHDGPPQHEAAGLRMWFARGQNFIVAYVEAQAGACFERADQPDEYVLLQPDESAAVDIEWQGRTTAVAGHRIAFVPAGASALRVRQAGRLVLLFSTQSADLCARCSNQAAYEAPHPYMPPFAPWPTAADGPCVRHHSLDVADEPGRFGRIWRCSTFMVNVLPAQVGPRDVAQLSPHHHDDFEQGSLALEGAFVHHLRWPWTGNMHHWREDEAVHCGAPSIAVIPPRAIHTSRAVLEGLNQLVDIFSPPRWDFSLKPGWVLNADDYPLPKEGAP
ncbi:hypothetical protein F9K07_14245 [Hydrogenophaga sp. BPS33]|nr:hypothetical protein F9K07_14245 [Hydrogenophaga sp. BPS33]